MSFPVAGIDGLNEPLNTTTSHEAFAIMPEEFGESFRKADAATTSR